MPKVTPYTVSLTLLALFALFLVSCSKSTPPEPSLATFDFEIDPKDETVTLRMKDATSLLAPSATGEPRTLQPNTELKLENFRYQFQSGNKLIIDATFKNVTDALAFTQPFGFTASSWNIVSSIEPVVSDEDLGGDGVLSSGETTATLRFEVIHRGSPFFYSVRAFAVVQEESTGEAPKILSFEVDNSVVLFQDLDNDGLNDPYDILHVTGPNPSFATFTKLNWQIESVEPTTLTLMAVVNGKTVSAVVDTEFADSDGNVDDIDTTPVALSNLQVDGTTVLLTDFEVDGQALATKDNGAIDGVILDVTQNPYIFTLTAKNASGETSVQLDLTCCQSSRAFNPN